MTFQRRQFLQSAAALTALGSSAALAGSPSAFRADDLWFINTCRVPCGRLSEAQNACWSASRMSPGQSWQRSSIEQFFAATGDGRITIFFVHGHRVNMHWAMESGWEVYRGLAQACPAAPPPFRFVIWKWPSEGGGRPIPDAREKAGIADQQSYKLGWFIGHIPPQTPLSFVGFSFGPRVIAGALHLSAAGTLQGRRLDMSYASRTRNVFWAAGSNYDWLVPGHRHGNAIQATDALLNLYNCCDPVLRFYPRVGGAAALGRVGMPASWLGADASRYAQRNVCGEVDRMHLTRNYSQNPSVLASTRRYALWQAV
jgi:hypothetical protein